MMEAIRDLASFIQNTTYIRMVVYKMIYSLANTKKEMHMIYLQLMQLLQLATTSLASLFALLIC